MKEGDWVTPNNETGWAGLVVKIKYAVVKRTEAPNILLPEGKRAVVRIPVTAPIIREKDVLLTDEELEQGYYEGDVWRNVIVIPESVAKIINS